MDENINSIINYSIIIPHKNIPDLLQRCLNSIPRRDDIQIIVVDDNSDPAKVDFNKFPGVGEKCVEVYFTKESKGAGYARNIGLKHAVGKWLLFADADDFYTIEFLPIVDRYKDSNNDIIFFNINSAFSDTLVPTESRFPAIKEFIRKKDYERLRYASSIPVGKLVKNDLIIKHKIKFDETLASNDVMFSCLTGYFAKNIECCNDCIYCATIRSGSLSDLKKMPVEILDARLSVSYRQYSFLKSIHKRRYSLNALYYVNMYKKYDIRIYRKRLLEFFKQKSIFYIIVDYLRIIKAQILNN